MRTDITDQAPDPELERRWAAIQAKLAAVADQLIRQGTMVIKTTSAGREIAAIRYTVKEGGVRVHKSIYIGDHPALIARARRLLDRYRERQQWPQEVAAYARLALATNAMARRLMPSQRVVRPLSWDR